MKDITYIIGINLQLFAVQVTTQDTLSAEMKTYYDMTLIDMAQANLVHDQFGQKRPIPQGSGKTIEFRKYAPLNKALTPITEGVTPGGNDLAVSSITATVAQYGDFVQISDVLELTAIDNNILEATKLLGRQAGLTLDTITREVLNGGTNVSYASKWSGTTETAVASRSALNNTAALKVDTVYQTVAKLRAVNAPTINGDYVAIIHPYVAYDLMRDPEWIDSHKYAEPDNLYTGEIGKIGGVRFVQTTEAKIARGEPLTAAAGNLTVKTSTSSGTTLPVKEKITSADVTAFAARESDDKKVVIGGTEYAVSALVAGDAGSAYLTMGASIAATIAADSVVAPIGSAGDGGAVFCTLFLGDGAYGVTEVTGGGLQTIIHNKGEGGPAQPLDLFSSVGWKAIKTAEILIPDYMVRVESCSPRYSAVAAAN